MRKSKEFGFNLIELLVVLVILGLLAGLVTPAVVGYMDGAKHKATALRITKLKSSIARYMLDTGSLPTTLNDLRERPTNTEFWLGPYSEKTDIVDGWDRPYHFTVPGDAGREYDIYFEGSSD